MMIDSINFEAELCRRTLANLEAIRALKDKKEVYEVTQLLNSLLGCVININETEGIKFNQEQNGPSSESMFKDVTFYRSEKENRNQWGIPDNAEIEKLSEIIYILRNASAHMQFEPKAKHEENEIESIKFSSSFKGREISIVFTEEELNTFLRKLCNHIIKNTQTE